MPGWVGPTIAIAMVIIAFCVLGVTVALLFAAKEAAERTHGLSRELAELRQELTPALQALNRLGASGAEVADLAREEVRELVRTSQRLRHDVERGAKGFRRRAADLAAVVDVVQEEVEETALALTSTLHSVRTGGGMLSQLKRLVRPRRRLRR
jgi:methyl-accepting chemotaxis protein